MIKILTQVQFSKLKSLGFTAIDLSDCLGIIPREISTRYIEEVCGESYLELCFKGATGLCYKIYKCDVDNEEVYEISIFDIQEANLLESAYKMILLLKEKNILK